MCALNDLLWVLCEATPPPPPFLPCGLSLSKHLVSPFMYLEVCSRSLQGSDRLQHLLQFTALVKRRHVAAASDALLADEHPRDLRLTSR